MRLVHVQRLAKLTAKGRDEHLVDLELHDEVREPPALRVLDTILIALAVCQLVWGDTRGRDRHGDSGLLGAEHGLHHGREGRAAREGEVLSPEDAEARTPNWGLLLGFLGMGIVGQVSMAMS